MDIESVVLVISVILLFVIGYVAVGVLIPIRGRSESAETDAESKKHTARKMNRAVFAY